MSRIRAMQKVGGNKECLDCTEKGPQSIVLNFSTFVCTVCSGIHREFNHRIKSISMSKFSPEEVADIEAKGNDKMHAVCVRSRRARRRATDVCDAAGTTAGGRRAT